MTWRPELVCHPERGLARLPGDLSQRIVTRTTPRPVQPRPHVWDNGPAESKDSATQRRSSTVGVAVSLAFACGAKAQAPLQLTPDQLFASASPAVVKLTIKEDDQRPIGTGSGFIIASDKLSDGVSTSTVITNYHVIYPAVFVAVAFQDDGTGAVNRVVVEDPSADIAVLEVLSSCRSLQALKLCAGQSPAIGTKVFTIGSPLGFTNTLSEGLVSGYRERNERRQWMQITAPISPGSSGGPVLSIDGCVLGMTTATTTDGQNVNFAVPAKEISRALKAQAKPRGISHGASLRLERQFADWDAEWQLLRLSGRSEAEAQREASAVVYAADCEHDLLQKGVREGDQLALFLTAQCLSAYQRDDEAVAMLKRATDAKPGEFAYLAFYELGWALRAADSPTRATGGRTLEAVFEGALRAWIKAKELRPDFAPARFQLAEACRVLDRYPEALLEADAVVSLLPRCYKGYVERGKILALLGRREAFERDFEQAARLRPNDAEVYNDKAEGYEALDACKDVAEASQAAIALDPDNWLAHVRVVSALAQMGRCDEAFDHFHKAKLGELTPDNALGLQILKCRARATQGRPGTHD